MLTPHVVLPGGGDAPTARGEPLQKESYGAPPGSFRPTGAAGRPASMGEARLGVTGGRSEGRSDRYQRVNPLTDRGQEEGGEPATRESVPALHCTALLWVDGRKGGGGGRIYKRRRGWGRGPVDRLLTSNNHAQLRRGEGRHLSPNSDQQEASLPADDVFLKWRGGSAGGGGGAAELLGGVVEEGEGHPGGAAAVDLPHEALLDVGVPVDGPQVQPPVLRPAELLPPAAAHLVAPLLHGRAVQDVPQDRRAQRPHVRARVGEAPDRRRQPALRRQPQGGLVSHTERDRETERERLEKAQKGVPTLRRLERPSAAANPVSPQ